MAEFLGSDQPLFVIAPNDFGKELNPRSIEIMAADRLPLILNAQPKGPYRLCGYCLAGLVAFEVARMLVAAEEQVEMVGMIDSPTVNARRSVQLLLSAMRCAQPIAGSVVDRAVVRVSYICLQLDRPLNVLKSWLGKVFKWRTDDVPSSVIAMSHYAPRPISVPVIYYAAEFSPAAWRRISSDIETVQIPGDHGAVVRDPANLAKIRLSI